MNLIQADEELRKDLKAIYEKNEFNVQRTRLRLCEEAKLALNTVFSFERGNHNIGFKLMLKLSSWVNDNK